MNNQTIEIKELNKILSRIDYFEGTYSCISDTKSPDYDGMKSQGDTGERERIFDIKIEGVFLKASYEIDSYGENEILTSLKFVSPVKKEVIVYE